MIIGNFYTPYKNENLNYTVFNQYKSLKQKSVDNYNQLLADSQNSGKPVSLSNFNNVSEADIESYLTKGRGGFILRFYGSDLVTKLSNLIENNNNKLSNRLVNVNNAIKNNQSVDYDSLKVVNNNSELKPIIADYVKDNRDVEMLLKMAITTMTIVFAIIIISFILRVLISTM